MPIILLVEKTGNIKQQKIQDTNLDNLYKKAGFKNNDSGEFRLQTTWNVEGTSVSLYGKTEGGKAGMENKYDFPPPVDSLLFFGSCILVCVDAAGGKMQDLKLETWTHMYEILFGGFEDLGDEDSQEEEDLETDDEIEMLKGAAKESGLNVVIKKTRDGYINDGFVVDDDDEDDGSFVESESSFSEEEVKPKKRGAKKTVTTKKEAKIVPVTSTPKPAGRKGGKKKVEVEEPVVQTDVYMECTEELEEEEYV